MPKDRKAFFEAGKVKGSKEAIVDSGNYPALFAQADPTYAQPSARVLYEEAKEKAASGDKGTKRR